MLKNISNVTLMKVASLGGILTVTMGLLYRWKINEKIAQTEYYKDAMKTLRTNPGAKYLLGEPIRDGRIAVDDMEHNYTRQLEAYYEVPVKGSKEKGIMHFWANRPNPQDTWLVNRIELALSKEPNRRLLVKSLEK